MFGSENVIIYFSIASLIPVLIILFYVYKKDRFPEPPRIVFITFALGVATIFPILMIIPLIEGFAENLNLFTEPGHFYFAFIRAALLEEIFKWLVIIYYCAKLNELNEPMDALVYGVAASLGFAAFENFEYVTGSLQDSVELASSVAWLRAFTAVPLHAMCGAIMGYFLIKAIFIIKNKNINLFLSLFAPVIIHGLYDYILMSEVIASGLIYPLLIILVIITLFIFGKERRNQDKMFFEGQYNKYNIDNFSVGLTILISLSLLSLAVFTMNIFSQIN
ncbi:PrsW family glutamic-type intramembrane protease [Pelagibacterales bacterium]|nr:PrsW family glutamic-type intramembrane protease [Pelagibacterales bacterium]